MRTGLMRFTDAVIVILLPLIMLSCCDILVRASIPTLFGEAHGKEMAFNRRLDVTAFTLGYFQKPFNLPSLAASLGSGSAWAQKITAQQMGRVMKNSGLLVVAKKGLTFADLAKRLAKGSRPEVAILFLGNASGIDQLGYCLALTRYCKKGFYDVDISGHEGWLSLQDAKNWLGHYFKGSCLLVRAGDAPEPSRVYSLNRSREIVLNIGEISSGPGIIEVPFLLHDTLDRAISIRSARGSCFCFKGAEIAGTYRSILAGAVGKVVLSFSRAEIGVGIITREVLISLKGYRGHFVKVLVKCHITATHPPIQLTWYPQAIDLGVVRESVLVAAQGFTVLTPKGVSLKTASASSKVVAVTRLGNRGGEPQTDSFGRTAHEFVVHFIHLPLGAINQKITIRTTDKYVPKIVIRITGQVEK